MRIARIVVFILAFVTSSTLAQEGPNLESGLKPFGSYQGGNLDSVSLTNGNLTLHIPLISIPQRGDLRLDYFLVFNAKNWYVKNFQINNNTVAKWQMRGASGVSIVSNLDVKDRLWQTYPYGCDEFFCVSRDHREIITPDGSHHQLGPLDASNNYATVDATGWKKQGISGFAPNMTSSDGITYWPASDVAARDRNGNQITISSGNYLDTLGRLIQRNLVTSDLSNCPSGTTFARLYTYPNYQATNSSIKLCFGNISVSTAFTQPNVQNFTGTSGGLLGAVLADATRWLFTYDSYGNLASITLPTGGTISYTWVTTDAPCGSGLTTQSRSVASRMVADNTGVSGTWTYNWSPSVPGYSMSNIVTDPVGNQTANYLVHPASSCSGFVGKTEYYEGSVSSANLRKVVETTFAGEVNPFDEEDTTGANILPTAVKTTVGTRVTYSSKAFDTAQVLSFSDVTCSNCTWNLKYGNLLQQDDYDGSSGSNVLLRSTFNAYKWQADANYKNNNLLTLISETRTEGKDPVTNVWGQRTKTTFAFDESGLGSSGVGGTLRVTPGNHPYRGNVTSVKQWLDTTGADLTTTNTYFDSGMLQQTTDPAPFSHTTTFQYSPTYQGAYRTQTCRPTTNSGTYTHCVSGTYDFNTGLLATFTDENNQTSDFTYDSMQRLTNAKGPAVNVQGSSLRPETRFTYYSWPAYTPQVRREQRIDLNRWTDLWVTFDGLGREQRRAAYNEESTPYDQTDICYDSRGNVAFKPYPYQGSGSSTAKQCPGVTTLGDTYTYDGLGRTTRVTHSDGTYIQTDYTGWATKVADEGNGANRITRVSQLDALGNLASVCEVTSAAQQSVNPTPCGQDIAATGFITNYTYYPTGWLYKVAQGTLQDRTFKYDSLGRLKEATNPESGTTSYTYQNDGPVSTRVRPAPNQTDPNVTVTTTYAYDELHRLGLTTYSDSTPQTLRAYDQTAPYLSNTRGRLTATFVGSPNVSRNTYTYDALGRVTTNWQCTPLNCTAQTDAPLDYTYDLLGNILTATYPGALTFTSTYNKAGRITALTSSLVDANHPGTLLSNVHYGAFGLTTDTLGNGIAETKTYTPRGFLDVFTSGSVYSLDLNYHPDGNISSANDSVNGNWSYSYDDFNRLSAASKTGASYTWAYDRYGNRWQQNGPVSKSIAFTTTNNRAASGGSTLYDASGNVRQEGTAQYTFDAENRMIAAPGATYVYDADGKRVRKTVSGNNSDFLYDLAGHAITELYNGAWSRTEIYAGGKRIATYSGTTTNFNHADWLGTTRVSTSPNGIPTQTCTSLPFGDGQACTGSLISPNHFTDKEQDQETGLHLLSARYYNSTLGMFTSTDLKGGNILEPQTLNRYSYVTNNPLAYIDPDGMEKITVERTTAEFSWLIGHSLQDLWRAVGEPRPMIPIGKGGGVRIVAPSRRTGGGAHASQGEDLPLLGRSTQLYKRLEWHQRNIRVTFTITESVTYDTDTKQTTSNTTITAHIETPYKADLSPMWCSSVDSILSEEDPTWFQPKYEFDLSRLTNDQLVALRSSALKQSDLEFQQQLILAIMEEQARRVEKKAPAQEKTK